MCVKHTDKYSVCPSCSFHNPYSQIEYEFASAYFHKPITKGFKCCDKCVRYYYSRDYEVWEKLSSIKLNICMNCIDEDMEFYSGCGFGYPIPKPNSSNFPSEDIAHNPIHQLSLSYL
jgi:hypothetical protein